MSALADGCANLCNEPPDLLKLGKVAGIDQFVQRLEPGSESRPLRHIELLDRSGEPAQFLSRLVEVLNLASDGKGDILADRRQRSLQAIDLGLCGAGINVHADRRLQRLTHIRRPSDHAVQLGSCLACVQAEHLPPLDRCLVSGDFLTEASQLLDASTDAGVFSEGNRQTGRLLAQLRRARQFVLNSGSTEG